MSDVLQRAAVLAIAIRNNPDPAEAGDDSDFLEDRLCSIPRYFSQVISHEVVLSVSRFRLEAEEYQEKCEAQDSKRRLAHERMTSSINQVNRLCKVYAVPPVFVMPGKDRELDMNDINDRANAAQYAYGFCREVFTNAQSGVYTDNKVYTDQEIGEELSRFVQKGDPFFHRVSLEKLIELAVRKQKEVLA